MNRIVFNTLDSKDSNSTLRVLLSSAVHRAHYMNVASQDEVV